MDAYTTALALLARRDLSTRQLRDRLARRRFAADDIDETVARLSDERALDDRRVATALARTEATVRRRGRRRVLQRLLQQGISRETAAAAVDDVFATVDEHAMLDESLARRLEGVDPRTLDARATARIVRALTAAGFDTAAVLARLRRKGARADE